MINLNAKTIINDSVSRAFGFDKYRIIMNRVTQINVATNKDFQTLFDGYYKVRRNDEWRKAYFELMQNTKSKENVTFEYIIRTLYRKTNCKIEPSFSSKLLATLDPDKPIWDQYVVSNLGKKIQGKTDEEKLKSAISIYDEIDNEIHVLINSTDGIECIREFDKIFPDYSDINAVKKIDFFLWSKRS